MKGCALPITERVKRFLDQAWLLGVPLLLAALAFTALGLTFRDGPEFSDSAQSASTAQANHLADFNRLEPRTQNLIEGELEELRRISNLEKFQKLQTQIHELTEILPETSCLVVKQGETEVYSQSAPIRLRPASGQKLLTALAALLILGPEYTYTTEVRAFASPENGELEGSLYLVGSGDPFLWTDELFQFRDNITSGISYTSLDRLADQLVEAGITSITGGVAGVETKYDTQRYPPSWPRGVRNSAVGGSLSALSINHSYVLMDEEWISINPPTQAGAAVFDDLLEARGVTIPRVPFVSRAVPPVVLTSVVSPPLKDIVGTILSVSDNTAAELLLKEIGFARQGRGSTEAGIQVVFDVLTEAGVFSSSPELPPGDGSGVAETNRTTCRELVSILEYGEQNFSLTSSLAVAGERGTLQDRFTETIVAGRLYAKTGTWPGVASLSGYVRADNGEEILFSYISNDSLTGTLSFEERRNFESSLATLLIDYLNTE